MRFIRQQLMGAVLLCAASASQAGGVLHFANWSDYYPPQLLQKFEKDTGIKATLDSYDGNETLAAKLKAGSGNYDVIVPSDSYIQILAKDGLLMKLDHTQLPNFRNVKAPFDAPSFDPKRDYTMPYMWGTTGFSYDSARVPGGRLPDSWKSLFEPIPELKGKIGMLDSEEDVYMDAAWYLGLNECTENPEDAKKILALLLKQKPYVATYNNDGTIERMIAGEVIMHEQWNGAYFRVKEKKPSVVYVYPKEGVRFWMDNFAIPAKAQNVKEAYVFINWMMQPENIALASNFTKYNNAIAGSDKFMDAALFKDPAINTPKDMTSRFRPFRLCSPAALALRGKVWVKFKQ